MPVFKYGFRPLTIVVLHMQRDYFAAMSAELLHVGIIKFKNILNNLVFLSLNSTLLVAL